MWSAGTHDEGTPQQHGKGKRTMFDKRLFQLAPGLEKLIAGKVALMWVGLLANIGFMLSLVMLLNSMLTAVAPPLLQCGGTSQGAACPVPLSDQHGHGCAAHGRRCHDLRAACSGLHNGSVHGHHACHPLRHRSRRAGQTGFAIQAVPQNGGTRPVLQNPHQDLGCGAIRRRRC